MKRACARFIFPRPSHPRVPFSRASHCGRRFSYPFTRLFAGRFLTEMRQFPYSHDIFSWSVRSKNNESSIEASDTFGDFIRRSRRSAKIARCARYIDCDFRRSPRSAYKIADIWHVRYRRLIFILFLIFF